MSIVKGRFLSAPATSVLSEPLFTVQSLQCSEQPAAGAAQTTNTVQRHAVRPWMPCICLPQSLSPTPVLQASLLTAAFCVMPTRSTSVGRSGFTILQDRHELLGCNICPPSIKPYPNFYIIFIGLQALQDSISISTKNSAE